MATVVKEKEVIKEVEISEHFEELITNWDYRTYLAVGGYGSGKSYDIALKLILKLLEEKRKALVVRKVYATLRDSTFALLDDIVDSLGLPMGTITSTVSPLGIKFKNGSEIIFKGLDSKEKLKSVHNVSIIWVEEASELDYEDYKELLGRARHPSDSIHFLLSTNPVSKSNWTFTHFFIDDRDPENVRTTLRDETLYRDRVVKLGNTYYHHSTAEDNPFLPDSYTEQLDELEYYDPDLYRVAREGKYGTVGNRVLPQLRIKPHKEVKSVVERLDMHRAGMDFGFVTSYNAALKMAIDVERKYLYIYWEYYKNNMTDDKTAVDERFQELKSFLIRADSAEPKTIQYYNQQGYKMVGAKKPTKIEGVKKIKRFKKIIVSERCNNAIRELKDLTYKEDSNGNTIEDEFNIDSHCFDAIKYGLDGYEVSDLKDRKNYSGKGVRG